MKKLPLPFLLIFIFSLGIYTIKAQSINIPVAKKWKHSFEEDKNGIEVYRLESYRFPPARIREGFMFLPRGEFQAYTLSADDKPLIVKGSWKKNSDNPLIFVTFNDENNDQRPKKYKKGFVMEIISQKADKLEVRIIPAIK